MKYKVIVNNKKIEFKSNRDVTNEKIFLHCFKLALSRKYHINICDFLNDAGFELRICKHCNKRYVLPDIFEYSVNKDEIILYSVKYSREWYYCSSKECPGRLLNPNSIEFVSKTYSLSDEEAVSFIHVRNKSPFYRENHSSEEEYIKYQTRDEEWYKERGKNIKESVEKGLYHKTLEYKIKTFGDIGAERYFKSCKSKSMLDPNIIAKRYNTTDEKFIIEKQIEHLITCSHYKLDKEIFYDADKLCEYVYYRLPLYVREIPDSFAIKEAIKKPNYKLSKTIETALKNLGLTIDTFINNVLLPKILANTTTFENFPVKRIQEVPATMGYCYVTKEGELLRSSFEKDFYLKMHEVGLNEKKYSTDKIYPNQIETAYRYDFYFQEIDTYVEIAGLFGEEEYNKKLKLKKEMFNPLIVYTQGDITNVINIILERYENNSIKSSYDIEELFE